jgi:hypothetical protein
MPANPRIRRLGLIRVSHPDEGVRRYLLARLDDISLATPPTRNGLAAVDRRLQGGPERNWPTVDDL